MNENAKEIGKEAATLYKKHGCSDKAINLLSKFIMEDSDRIEWAVSVAAQDILRNTETNLRQSIYNDALNNSELNEKDEDEDVEYDENGEYVPRAKIRQHKIDPEILEEGQRFKEAMADMFAVPLPYCEGVFYGDANVTDLTASADRSFKDGTTHYTEGVYATMVADELKGMGFKSMTVARDRGKMTNARMHELRNAALLRMNGTRERLTQTAPAPVNGNGHSANGHRKKKAACQE